MSNLKLHIGSKSNKEALLDWNDLLREIRTATPVRHETLEEKAARIKMLEKPGNQELWFQEYFPNYYKSKAAKFQIASTKKLLGKKRYRQSRMWARGLSKSTRRMFEIMYKMFVEKYPVYLLLVSKSEDNAIRLLSKYRATLQGNQRLISDYGHQKGHKWAEHEFVTRKRAVFRAVGMEQNPRGAALDETRATILIFDDADDDEVCRNTDRLSERYKWVERSVMPTIDIAEDYLMFFDNNIIAEDSIAVRWSKYSRDVEVVPVLDDNGNSTWPERNGLEDIALIREGMTDASFQTEYLCNPIREGAVFEKMNWGKCPPLKSLQLAVIYNDPATSNQDKPTGKSTAQNSCKSSVILGYKDGKFYVYNCRLDHMNNEDFVTGIYDLHDYVVNRAPGLPVYSFIENNTLQDPFFEQVLKPSIHRVAKKMHRAVISIAGDDRKKPHKFFRVEATLQPLNKNGQLILNEDEKANPHMTRLESQFLSVSPNSKTIDGPDCAEGGVWIIQNKISLLADLHDTVRYIPRATNKKRY